MPSFGFFAVLEILYIKEHANDAEILFCREINWLFSYLGVVFQMNSGLFGGNAPVAMGEIPQLGSENRSESGRGVQL
jgi:hypothetical protein